MMATLQDIRATQLASELKTLAGKGCGDCYQQDCDWPKCSPKAMALTQAAPQPPQGDKT